MVSPTPTTAHPPVLSYAESAKKAQGVRHPSQPAQKPLSNPPRQPPAPPPELKKPPKSSSSVDIAQISLADLSLSDASAPGLPGANIQSHTSTGESTTHDSSTREVALHGTPSAASVPPLTPSHPPPAKAAPAPAPVPNVWNQRIQQRAQARSQPRPSQPQPQPQTPSSHIPRATSPPRDSSITSSGSRQPDPVGSASVQSTQSPSLSSLNGASSSTPGSSTGTTPSSRKELLLSPQRSSLVTDVESWPEVGKCHIPAGKSQRIGNGHVAVAEEKDVEEKNADVPSSSHPGTPRKSEKTKWIVIPPEELQAAADAIKPPRPYSQSRSHSARDSQPRSAAVSASGSTHNSQTPSKVTSRRTSASHSRAHSPNSIASSPHHSGRSRQLPVDFRGDQAPEQPPRSSEGNSPQAPVDVAAPVPYYVQNSRDVYGYGNLPTQTSSAQSFVQQPPPPPHQPHYPPPLQVNPNHTQQPYASSSVSPYPQPYTHHGPSDRYGPASAQPLPPGWGPTDHFVYSYGYPPYAQAHPIMYWPGNLPLDLRQDGRTMYPTYPQVHPHQPVPPPGHILQDDGDPPREGVPTSQPTLPPPTMISRPPPPQESDAVAGYRAMGPVLDTGSRLEEAPRGRCGVIFGSIGASRRSPSPSPPLLLSSVSPLQLEGSSASEKSDRVAMVYSIGVAPGEAGPPHVRSRTRSQPRLSRAENTTDGKGPEPHAGTEVKVIDLTDPEIKWEFGTANRSQDEFTQGDENRPGLLEPQSRSLAPAVPPNPTLDVNSLLFGGPLQGSSLPVVAAEPPLAELQHSYPHAHHPIPYVLPQQQIHVPPRSPAQEEFQAQVGPGPYQVHHPPPPQSLPSASTDGFEVKDFGYGFGRTGGTGHGVASPREERFPREREWERNREPDREHYHWRGRRGSYSGHNERGGYGRRARGGVNGFGRGLGRGRWNTFRQQQQQQHQRQQQQQQQQQPQQQQAPPFTVTPPAQAFQPLQPSTPPPRAPPDVGQYLGTTVQQPPYVAGFEAYQAPVPLSYPSQNAGVPGATQGHPLPRPLSNLTFPLDSTRYYLLGQLEYYLSAQNLVSDIFLRKRMDSRGWIPISLLASFNRVRQLTLDTQLVREVLALSQIVEIRDDCVRMGGGEWAQFVLADAPVSTVERTSGEAENGEEEGGHVEEEGEVEEEDEEEDIEIVMDREVIGQRWMGPSSSTF